MSAQPKLLYLALSAALLALLVTACGGPSPTGPDALYALAKEQIANANYVPAIDNLAHAARAQPPGDAAARARALRPALLAAMARSLRDIGEAYLAGHQQAGDAPHAAQMRSTAMDYFGRARSRANEVVEALDAMVQQPDAPAVRVDLTAAPAAAADTPALDNIRQGRPPEYEDLVRLEKALVRTELAQVLAGLSRAGAAGAETEVELSAAAFYLGLTREIVGLADIYRDAALNDPRMRRLFFQRAATAAARAAELARAQGNQPLAQQAEQLVAECQDVLGKQ